jgi:hypothetical protein
MEPSLSVDARRHILRFATDNHGCDKDDESFFSATDKCAIDYANRVFAGRAVPSV